MTKDTRSESSEFHHQLREEHKARRKEVTPVRMKIALDKFKSLGITASQIDDSKILISHNGIYADFFPFTGWWSGKGIGSGRGLRNLTRKFTQTKEVTP